MHTCHDTASQCLPHPLRILENILLQKTLFCVHKARHRFETHLMCVRFSEQIAHPPILTSFLPKNVKVLRTTGPKFRKNSARVDFATFQDELKPKFLAKI